MQFRRVRQGVEPAVADLAENVPARVGSCDHSIQVKPIQLTTASNGYMQTAAPNGFSIFHGMRVSGEKTASAQIVNSAPKTERASRWSTPDALANTRPKDEVKQPPNAR